MSGQQPARMERDGRDERETKPLFWVSRTAARRALIALHAAALLVVLAEVLHPFDVDDHGVERIAALEFIASYAVFGFVACVVLVVLGRVLRRAVMRDERYYDREP